MRVLYDWSRFLSFLVSCQNIIMQKNRKSIIRNSIEFITHFQMHIFFDFVNFYKWFIDEFSRVVAELINLMKDVEKEKFKTKFEMTFEKRKSFKRLKIFFMTISLFCHFDFVFKIFLKIDVSNFAISKILSQLIENDKWHSIVFWSRKMYSSKRN